MPYNLLEFFNPDPCNVRSILEFLPKSKLLNQTNNLNYHTLYKNVIHTRYLYFKCTSDQS